MHFISNILKRITSGRGSIEGAGERSIEGDSGDFFLRNGDEALTETAGQDEEEKVLGQDKEEKQEFSEIAMPTKTTGSVGNFGKHLEIGKEAGSMGERLGHLASVKEEQHYFQ